MRTCINDILNKYLCLNRFRNLFIFVIISLLFTPVFIFKHKNVKEKETKYPIEIVESINKSTKLNSKYEVKIKRIEILESEYILHTDSCYKINDTIKSVW